MQSGFRATVQFLGLMAAGLLAAAILALVMQGGLDAGPSTAAHRSAAGIDYGSFAAGLAFGIVLTVVGRVSWTDQIRQAVAWLFAHRRTLRRIVLATVFLAFLLFY